VRKPWFRNRIDHVVALGDLQDAMGRAEAAAPVRLEAGTRITAVTEGGTAVEGIVGRIYQAPRDAAAGVFRFAVGPAGDDSSSEEGRAS
jgi:hypothetical protein